jgi:hypothetical protein
MILFSKINFHEIPGHITLVMVQISDTGGVGAKRWGTFTSQWCYHFFLLEICCYLCICSGNSVSLIKETPWYHCKLNTVHPFRDHDHQLGAAVAFSLIVAGQLIMSVIMDHFGLFGVPVNPVTPAKLLGFLLLIAGVVLIRK